MLNPKLPINTNLSSLNPLQLKSSLDIPKVNLKKTDTPITKGIVVDALTNLPLKGVKILSINNAFPKSVKTNSNGVFEIPIPSIDNPLKISLKDYSTVKIIPYKGDDSPKLDLGPILLKPIKADITEDKLNSLQLDNTQLSTLLKLNKNGEFYLRKRLTDTVKDLKQQVIPITLTMLSQYGISKANELIQQQKPVIELYIKDAICPAPEIITQLLNTKNKLYKKINIISTTVDNTTKALGITTGILGSMDIALKILKELPVPVAVAGVGIPMNVITKVQDSIKKIEGTISKLTAISAGTLSILVVIRQTLTQLMQYLNLLDMLLQHCAPNTPQAQETLNTVLLNLTKEAEQQSVIISSNINGFTLTVETEITEKPLKRKRAIAKNRSGVNLLQGEWSFSSIDQILIDELTFYIQTNDLKAY